LARLYEEGTVVMSGPFADDSGALLIVDVPDEAALDQLIENDPYFRTPGVTITLRQEWTPLFGGR
jgi:uncharacterized protein